MEIQESGENYLEAVLVLSRRQSEVRAKDLCTYFQYSRPTVSVAVHHLQEKGYLLIRDNLLSLTPSGERIAAEINIRHNLIATLLMELGVTEKTAFDDACKIEHDISRESFDCIQKHMIARGKIKE